MEHRRTHEGKWSTLTLLPTILTGDWLLVDMQVAYSVERMGASEDTSMLEQDAWLLLMHCVGYFLSVKKERVIFLSLNAFFFCIF